MVLFFFHFLQRPSFFVYHFDELPVNSTEQPVELSLRKEQLKSALNGSTYNKSENNSDKNCLSKSPLVLFKFYLMQKYDICLSYKESTLIFKMQTAWLHYDFVQQTGPATVSCIFHLMLSMIDSRIENGLLWSSMTKKEINDKNGWIYIFPPFFPFVSKETNC